MLSELLASGGPLESHGARATGPTEPVEDAVSRCVHLEAQLFLAQHRLFSYAGLTLVFAKVSFPQRLPRENRHSLALPTTM